MAYTVETRTNSPANDLRDGLEKAERLVVGANKSNIEEFLVLLDAIEGQFDQLAESSMDLRPEGARWQSLISRLSAAPSNVVRAGNAAGGWRQLREQHPPAESFWWRLDAIVAEQRKKAIRRTFITVGSVVVVALLALWIMNTFFPPDPNTLIVVDATSNIEQLVTEGRWEAAMAIVEETRTILPDDPELLIWEIVLSERLGDEARAAHALAEAEQVLADRLALLWVTLGQYRLQTGDAAGADAAATTAVAIDDLEPQGYFLMANVAENMGDMTRAVDMYNKTFDLAEDDNPQLAVIAKVRLAQLLQSGPGMFPTEAPPEGTPTAVP